MRLIAELDLPVYKAIARKDLCFWCVVVMDSNDYEESVFWNGIWVESYNKDYKYERHEYLWWDDWVFDNIKSIIWHQIVLTDIIRYMAERIQDSSGKLLDPRWVIIFWDTKQPYFDKQPEGLKEYIRNLVLS